MGITLESWSDRFGIVQIESCYNLQTDKGLYVFSH